MISTPQEQARRLEAAAKVMCETLSRDPEKMTAGLAEWTYWVPLAEHVAAVLSTPTAPPDGEREELQPGRDHLTVTGKFQSDKYPWCPAGFVPLKTTDQMARSLLIQYAHLRGAIDAEFERDLLDALIATPPSGSGRAGGGEET